MKWIKIVSIGLLMFLAVAAKGQNEVRKDSLRAAKVEELRKFRESLFVERLSLTDAEKTKFFVIYDEYQLKLRDAKRAFRAKWEGKRPSELSDAEAELYFKDAIALRKLEVQLMETYTVKLKPVIGMQRAVQLPKIEREVKKELIAKARSMRKKKKGPGEGGGGEGRPGDDRPRKRRPAGENPPPTTPN
jgi:anion-transporting  ArsA/GET3 family ATPase